MSTTAPSPKTSALMLIAGLNAQELAVADAAISLGDRLTTKLGAVVSLAAEIDARQRGQLADAVGHLRGHMRSDSPQGQRYGHDGHKEALRDCAKHFGRAPTVRMYKGWQEGEELAGRSAPHYNSVIAAFGKWTIALAKAGLT